MEQKQGEQTQKTTEKAAASPKSGNKTLLWILGGCLALFIVASFVIGGLAYWSYKKVKKEIKKNQPKIEEWQNQMEKVNQEAPKNNETSGTTFNEEPQASDNSSAAGSDSIEFPANTERQMGYIKKVYTKGGKNYLDIDYIQWLTGDAAEKAMREDGKCPRAGECIVYDGYYIRNQNPLIRTFEISPDAAITMQTYNIETTGQIQAQSITFSQFSQIWNGNARPNLKNVPYIVEICNNQIVKINEQYIP